MKLTKHLQDALDKGRAERKALIQRLEDEDKAAAEAKRIKTEIEVEKEMGDAWRWYYKELPEQLNEAGLKGLGPSVYLGAENYTVLARVKVLRSEGIEVSSYVSQKKDSPGEFALHYYFRQE